MLLLMVIMARGLTRIKDKKQCLGVLKKEIKLNVTICKAYFSRADCRVAMVL